MQDLFQNIKYFLPDLVKSELLCNTPDPSSQHIVENVDVFCACVVASLLSVHIIGVIVALHLGNCSFLHVDEQCVESSKSLSWCTKSSRTAASCCRLFNYLKDTHEFYSIKCDPVDCASACEANDMNICWDLKMVSRYHTYLPRLNYELLLPNRHLSCEASSHSSKSFLDKVFLARLHDVLSDLNTYDSLRPIRIMLYQRILNAVDTTVKEILRNGDKLEAVTVKLSDDCWSKSFEGFFFRSLLNSPHDCVMDWSIANCCDNCDNIFKMRCLQMKTLAEVIGISFCRAMAVQTCTSDMATIFKVCIGIMGMNSIMTELSFHPCSCLRGVDLLRFAAEDDRISSNLFSQLELTNLWSCIETCAVHCEYVFSYLEQKKHTEIAKYDLDDTNVAFWKYAHFPVHYLSSKAYCSILRAVENVIVGKSERIKDSFKLWCKEKYSQNQIVHDALEYISLTNESS